MWERAGGRGGGEVLDGPRVDPAAVWQLVLRLQQVAALAEVAAQELPRPEQRWTGAAAVAFGHARTTSIERLGLAAGAGAQLAQVLTTYAQAVEHAQGAVTGCQRELDDLTAERERRAALVAVGLPDPGSADLDQRLRAVRRKHEQVMSTYGDAVGVAARALGALYDQVPAGARGMTAGDRAEQAWRGFGQAALVDPVEGLWALSGEALVDRHRWEQTVAALPGAIWEQAVHPGRSLEDDVGADYWQDNDGDWAGSAGATGGVAAGMVFGGGLGRIGREAARDAERAAAGAAGRALERPPLQDLADTFDAVDLDNHEAHGGHTLEKHVDVTDEDLRQRLLKQWRSWNGHLPDGKPRDVSRWASREVAEEWITKTLEARSEDIDRWLASPGDDWQEFVLENVPPDVGTLFRLHVDKAISQEVPTAVTVALRRSEAGVSVFSAYPSIWPRP